jgi:chromosome segregation ATPase
MKNPNEKLVAALRRAAPLAQYTDDNTALRQLADQLESNDSPEGAAASQLRNDCERLREERDEARDQRDMSNQRGDALEKQLGEQATRVRELEQEGAQLRENIERLRALRTVDAG